MQISRRHKHSAAHTRTVKKKKKKTGRRLIAYFTKNRNCNLPWLDEKKKVGFFVCAKIEMF